MNLNELLWQAYLQGMLGLIVVLAGVSIVVAAIIVKAGDKSKN